MLQAICEDEDNEGIIRRKDEVENKGYRHSILHNIAWNDAGCYKEKTILLAGSIVEKCRRHSLFVVEKNL